MRWRRLFRAMARPGMLAQYKEQIQKVSQEQQKLGQLKKEATMKTIYIDADYLCHASAFSLP